MTTATRLLSTSEPLGAEEIGLVQETVPAAPPVAGPTSIQSLTNPAQAGRLLVLLAYLPSGTVTAVTDDQDGLWRFGDAATQGTLRIEGWYCEGTQAGTTTVTAHLSASLSVPLHLMEWRGVPASAVLEDASGQANAAAATGSTPSFTPGGVGRLVVGAVAANTGSFTLATASRTKGYSELPQASGTGVSGRAAWAYNPTGAQQVIWTLGSSAASVGLLLTFLARTANVAGPPPPPPSGLWEADTNEPPDAATLLNPLSGRNIIAVKDILASEFGVTPNGSGQYVVTENVWLTQAQHGITDDTTLDFRQCVFYRHGGTIASNWSNPNTYPLKVCAREDPPPKRLALVFSLPGTPPDHVGRIITPVTHPTLQGQHQSLSWAQLKWNPATTNGSAPADVRRPVYDFDDDGVQVWHQSCVIDGLRMDNVMDAVSTGGLGGKWVFLRNSYITECRDDIIETDNSYVGAWFGRFGGDPYVVENCWMHGFMGYSLSPDGSFPDRSAYTNQWRSSSMHLIVRAYQVLSLDRQGSGFCPTLSHWDEHAGDPWGHVKAQGSMIKQASDHPLLPKQSYEDFWMRWDRYAYTCGHRSHLGVGATATGDTRLYWNDGGGNPAGQTVWPFADAPLPSGMSASQVYARTAAGGGMTTRGPVLWDADWAGRLATFLADHPQFTGL